VLNSKIKVPMEVPPEVIFCFTVLIFISAPFA